jgi:hypothetical protein
MVIVVSGDGSATGGSHSRIMLLAHATVKPGIKKHHRVYTGSRLEVSNGDN